MSLPDGAVITYGEPIEDNQDIIGHIGFVGEPIKFWEGDGIEIGASYEPPPNPDYQVYEWDGIIPTITDSDSMDKYLHTQNLLFDSRWSNKVDKHLRLEGYRIKNSRMYKI